MYQAEVEIRCTDLGLSNLPGLTTLFNNEAKQF